MHERSLRPPKSALGHAQQALYTLYDTAVLEKAVFYFPRPVSDDKTIRDYAFAVVLLYHTARKVRGLFPLCLIGPLEITNRLSQMFGLTVCSDLEELSTHFPDKELFLEVDWTRNSTLGRNWFLEMFSATTMAGPTRNDIMYIYLYLADTQLDSLQCAPDFNSFLNEWISEAHTVLQPIRKRFVDPPGDLSKIMSYLTSSLEINPHALRNVTLAFTALLRGHTLQVNSDFKTSCSPEYFSSASVQDKLASVKITFRTDKGEMVHKSFCPSTSILSAIAVFLAGEKRTRSLRRVAVAFSGGKDSLCLLLHLALLSLMARRGLLDPVGLGDLGMLEVTPVTFDPRIPGFILDTIRGLCPCMLSIDDTAEGTVRLEQQVVGMDVSAKIARLDGASRQEAKKASACSVCSRCRRGTLASFVSTGGYDALALGHHLMDDLETLAITGIHGASFFGLRGYYHCEARDFASKVKHRVCILRPMLSVHVSEISRVVFHNGLSCVASNAAECSVSISKTTVNKPFPGERLRARKLLGSVDICGICAFRDRHRQAMAPFTGESY